VSKFLETGIDGVMPQEAKIDINYDCCNGCRTCMKACFIDVIRWDLEKKRPITPYSSDCVACFGCELACPHQCINVTPSLTTFPKIE
jgi:NAD-dependent dihydropyrimidine dehydrogenase PreA subunit